MKMEREFLSWSYEPVVKRMSHEGKVSTMIQFRIHCQPRGQTQFSILKQVDVCFV